MEERYTSYKLEKSRNGLTVPVINGIYLHSIYNPCKEGHAIAELHRPTLENNNNVLILGLGFGYHVEEIAKILNQTHKKSKIIILEPNRKLAEDFVSMRNFEDKDIEILSTNDISELFSDLDFINFLMLKPALVKHDASFTLDADFYKSFLSYSSPKEITGFKHILNQSSQKLFSQFNEYSIHQATKAIISQQETNSKSASLLMAFAEVVKSPYKGRM